MHLCRRLKFSSPFPQRVNVTPIRTFSDRTASGLSALPHAPPATKHVNFNGRMVILGFGSIGEGTLPLVLKHINMPSKNITIITAEDREKAARDAAARYGVNAEIVYVDQKNYESLLETHLDDGDFLLNLSVDISSCDLYKFCNKRNVLYLDTVIEPWKGTYDDANLPLHERTNYAFREEALKLKRQFGPDAPTAVITHGANPGLVSHFMKQGLINIAQDSNTKFTEPTRREEWAELAQSLGVKVIHIAERDNQIPAQPKQVGEFVNTWSIDGFISEGVQPSELGWGSHEKRLPFDGAYHAEGNQSAIYLNSPGMDTPVRTWTPMEGPFRAWAVTHGESISISDYLTVRDGDGQLVYRPTVHYAYHPCDAAVLSIHEFVGKNLSTQSKFRLIVDEVVQGVDELGVLFGGHVKNCYWYGSQLEINHSRELIEHNSATSLQVTAAAMAGVVWAMENPRRGIVEPEEMDHKRVLEIAGPYVPPVVGEYTDWTPLQDRAKLFDEDIDGEDPWQFENIRCQRRTPFELSRSEIPARESLRAKSLS